MATYSRQLLTGSSSPGLLIPVHEVGSPGTRIHDANAAPDKDEIHLWASNITNAPVTLTIEWGGLATADHLVDTVSIPANSLPIKVAPGVMLTGGLAITAYASTADAINLSGYVNRVSG